MPTCSTFVPANLPLSHPLDVWQISVFLSFWGKSFASQQGCWFNNESVEWISLWEKMSTDFSKSKFLTVKVFLFIHYFWCSFEAVKVFTSDLWLYCIHSKQVCSITKKKIRNFLFKNLSNLFLERTWLRDGPTILTNPV
jgi:hypothetical protein